MKAGRKDSLAESLGDDILAAEFDFHMRRTS